MAKRARLILILCRITWFFIVGQGFSQEKKEFGKMMRDMEDFKSDFTKFSEIHINNPLESRISLRLNHTAEQVNDYLQTLITITAIYREITTEADKNRMAPIVRGLVELYLNKIDMNIELVNTCIASTKVPGIATTGTRFKEEMRDIRNVLDPLRAWSKGRK